MTQQRLLVALRSLRDVPGVLGSFVWQRDGRLVASDVPQSCAQVTLAAVAERLQRLCEGFANVGDQFESTTLAFGAYKLHVCGVGWASVAIVVSNRVNMSALQLALSLTLRDLAQLTPVPASPLAPASQPIAPQPPPTTPSRSYRGQRIGS